MAQPESPQNQRIVVGVDGSHFSTAALEWAIAQAHLVGARLEAVMALPPPTQFGVPSASPVEVGDETRAILATVVTELVADVKTRLGIQVDVDELVVQGSPARVLLDQAKGASLLVLGTRGHGAFGGMLLGSVSQHCVQHAPCPVVVVPETGGT
jgi:nucleotide-binding universal stress UspA family protein